MKMSIFFPFICCFLALSFSLIFSSLVLSVSASSVPRFPSSSSGDIPAFLLHQV